MTNRRTFRKAAAAVVTAALALSLFALPSLALTSAPGTVHVGTSLNIRQSNTATSAVVGSLGNGASVTVLGTSGGWYRITSGGVTGWVSGHYLWVDATVDVTTTLNVRSAPGAGAALTGRLVDNTLVTVTDQTADGWAQIRWYGGTGWVSAGYLTLGNNFAGGTAAARTVTDAAQRVVGVRYTFGGTSVATGFDCSGLTMYAFSKIGVTLPHSSAQQATMGTWVSRADLRPGDLVFFDTDGGNNNITHEGIYLGDGMFVNAESGKVQRVNVCSLNNSYWSSVYMTARRIAN